MTTNSVVLIEGCDFLPEGKNSVVVSSRQSVVFSISLFHYFISVWEASVSRETMITARFGASLVFLEKKERKLKKTWKGQNISFVGSVSSFSYHWNKLLNIIILSVNGQLSLCCDLSGGPRRIKS